MDQSKTLPPLYLLIETPIEESTYLSLSLSVSVSVSVALYQKEEEEVRNGIDELDTDGGRCERSDITAEERCQTICHHL